MNDILLNVLAVIATAVATAVGSLAVAALYKLAAKFGYQATAQDQANTEAQVTTAIKVGVTTALPIIKEHGWNSPETHNAILEKATAYLSERFPDKTAQIVAAAQTSTGTPMEKGSPAANAAVSETIAARIPQVITEVAASPATPPVPPDPVIIPATPIIMTGTVAP